MNRIWLDTNWKTILFSAVFLLSCWQAECIHVHEQEQYQQLGFPGRKPYFQKSVYQAISIRTGSNDFLYLKNGPIILENCESIETKVQIVFDKNKYEPVINTLDNCGIFFFLYMKNHTFLDRHPLDYIHLRAVHEEYIFDMASIVVMTKESQDSNNHIFDVDGTDYIILNYFQFKIFLYTILSISILILYAEIKDLLMRYRNRDMYRQLSDTINYI
ncbi:uncharacterized protein [Leptinotarsa decemlineata]|uniref:uncharacterized protein n=1 Tax=Leptinotarsa decemlineata TaxID=7539 RepID=UPI003D303EA9